MLQNFRVLIFRIRWSRIPTKIFDKYKIDSMFPGLVIWNETTKHGV